ncbi:MAG: tRNA uridine-5-carboxymethylaminomethyl(34) synthesis GTPase MnmE [Clostridiales bacterium]|nr:tRNA uridine-5-carboxymethylaminomethyl(34) synthesis GTPase MnmE [Clostridiales bacterium]
MPLTDTIAAISTPLGRGGIGIVRISGSEALGILDKIFIPKGGRKPKSYSMRYGFAMDGQTVIDEVLASVMLGPNSYTTEDVVEINCHGGMRAVRSVLELALRSGARLAEPGEFTKRAFINGRIDLIQVEAVMELIDAKSRKAEESAARRLAGSLSRKISSVRERILTLQARIEVSIDYPEYEDEEIGSLEVRREAEAAMEDLKSLIACFERGRVFSEGLKVVIAGKPNVGKSSLLNALMNEDRAIVADIPGTTRDVLSEAASLAGVPVKLMDTAGLRTPEDAIESLGVGKSIEALEDSDLAIWVVDSSEALSEEDAEACAKLEGKKVIIVANKNDLPKAASMDELRTLIPEAPIVSVCAKDGLGLDGLESEISKMFLSGEAEMDDSEIYINARQRQSAAKALESLEKAARAAGEGQAVDLISIDLTDACDSLGEITGETAGDSLVDKIFKEFCVGK